MSEQRVGLETIKQEKPVRLSDQVISFAIYQMTKGLKRHKKANDLLHNKYQELFLTKKEEMPNFGERLDVVDTARFDSIEGLTQQQKEYFSGVISFDMEEFNYWREKLEPDVFKKVVTRLTGGKGYNSFEMVLDGKNVPAFECVTTNVYFDLLKTLEPQLREIFEPADKKEYTRWSYKEKNLESACAKAQGLFMNTKLPEKVETALRLIYDTLIKLGLLCSRSSGDKEDGLKTSIAGRNLSVLAITSYEVFREATLAVFASQWGIDSVRYALDNGFDLFTGGISALEQVYAAPTHSAVGFSFEDGSITYNIADGMGETLAQGGTSTAEVWVSPNLEVSDIESWNWQSTSEENPHNYTLIKNGQRVLEINIPIQSSAFVVNPNATNYTDTTHQVEINKRLDINVIKKVLPRLINQMRDFTAKNGGGQDCEFPINLDTDTIFNAQKRPNTSSLEIIEGMPEKPKIEQQPIFKGSPVGDGAFSGRLVILDVQDVFNKEVLTTAVTIGNEIIEKTYQPGELKVGERLVDFEGNEITPNSIKGDEFFVCANGTASYDGFLSKHPYAIYQETSETAHSPLLLAGEWGGLGIILNKSEFNSLIEVLASLGLKPGDTITVDNEGFIFKGEVKELVEWQEKVNIVRLKHLLKVSATELKPDGLKIGYNASSVEAAESVHEKVGEFINPLLRMEKLAQDILVDEEGKKLDISYVSNYCSEEQKNIYASKMANAIAKITILTKNTGLRFSGPCGAERTGYGAPQETKENPGKQGVYQGIREELRDPKTLEFQAKVVLLANEILGKEASRLSIYGQYTRTATEFKEWRDRLINFGVNPNITSIGSMGEVPSIIFDFEGLAKAGCKFVSVGTNDLVTLLLAVDGRINPSGSDAIAEHYPATVRPVIRALIYMGEEAKKHGMKIKLCGGILGKFPDLAPYLQEWGYESAPVNNTKNHLAAVNQLIKNKELPTNYLVNP